MWTGEECVGVIIRIGFDLSFERMGEYPIFVRENTKGREREPVHEKQWVTKMPIG